MKSKNLRKVLSMRIGDYSLRVENFDSWLEAIEEIEVGRLKVHLSSILEIREIGRLLEGLAFPSWVGRAIDRIACLLMIKYPEGLTKEELSSLAGIKTTSLTTLLTSKEKGLAEQLVKDNDIYKLQPQSLDWAIGLIGEAKEFGE